METPLAFDESTGEWTLSHFRSRVSFDKGFFLAVRAIQQLREKNKRLIFVGISGPSGAGKTSLAKKIVSVIPKSLILSLDNYLDGSRVVEENFDDYRLFDFPLLVQNLKDLKEGKSTDTPLYDFRKSGRYAYRKVEPPSSQVVIVEGTYVLREEIRDWFDVKIFSGGVHFDLLKRVMRDTQRTGQNPNESIQQVYTTVFPMYKAFIEPDLSHAQIHIENRFNPFMGLVNPTFTLKTNKQFSVEQMRSALQALFPSQKISERSEKYNDIYLHPPGEKPDSCVYWIRMRNVRGQYMILFSQLIKEDRFLISPRIEFNVDVRTLGGMMALGYHIGASLNRKSHEFCFEDKNLSISLDEIQQIDGTYVQLKGSNRDDLLELAKDLDLGDEFIDKSYIELYVEKIKASSSSAASSSPSSSSFPSNSIYDTFVSDSDADLTRAKL